VPHPPVDVLRPALEQAVAVARKGQAERPPVAPPPALRPVLRFRRLPAAALETVAAVLDADPEFRHRVAAAVDEDEIGPIAWLWLTRPPGWADEVARRCEDSGDRIGTRGRDDQRQMRSRLEGAERAATRAAERAATLGAELARAREEIAELRASRDGLAERCAELERSVATLTDRRATAVGELKRVEGLLVRRTEERRELESRVAELSAAPPATDRRAVDPEALLPVLLRLDRTAQALAAELATLRAGLGLDPEPAVKPDPRPRVRRREPLPIPPGLSGDSVEAAAHLVARPRAVLLVDGYNVSMAAWPEADLPEQRARLERLLADLTARIPGIGVDLVFDGAEVGAMARTGPRRAPGLTVRFTPADVEADDEILDLVDRYPATRPVIVASNDRRVREGARRRGANVVSATQLLATARL
jgi:predicted RNA-binding protein with PIN domain